MFPIWCTIEQFFKLIFPTKMKVLLYAIKYDSNKFTEHKVLNIETEATQYKGTLILMMTTIKLMMLLIMTWSFEISM